MTQPGLPGTKTEIVIRSVGTSLLPPILVETDPQIQYLYAEFLAAHTRNPNTRVAYAQALHLFFHHLDERFPGTSLDQINSLMVALHIEQFPLKRNGKPAAKATINQHLAAIRAFFAWMVGQGGLTVDPAAKVRGPKQRLKQGKTPVLSNEEMVQLFQSIDTSQVVGLRDRALIATMFYSFARIGAVLAMQVQDYFPKGKRYWLRLHEKGGKYHEVPVHHRLDEYLTAYLEAAGIELELDTPLFRRSQGRSRQLTAEPLRRKGAWLMIKRRAKQAGINTAICNHSFRGSGITNYLVNGGSRDGAQKIAAHEDVRTTALYDRREEAIRLDEIERIRL